MSNNTTQFYEEEELIEYWSTEQENMNGQSQKQSENSSEQGKKEKSENPKNPKNPQKEKEQNDLEKQLTICKKIFMGTIVNDSHLEQKYQYIGEGVINNKKDDGDDSSGPGSFINDSKTRFEVKKWRFANRKLQDFGQLAYKCNLPMFLMRNFQYLRIFKVNFDEFISKSKFQILSSTTLKYLNLHNDFFKENLIF